MVQMIPGSEHLGSAVFSGFSSDKEEQRYRQHLLKHVQLWGPWVLFREVCASVLIGFIKCSDYRAAAVIWLAPLYALAWVVLKKRCSGISNSTAGFFLMLRSASLLYSIQLLLSMEPGMPLPSPTAFYTVQGPAGLLGALSSCVLLPLGVPLPAYQQVPLCLALEWCQYLILFLFGHHHNQNMKINTRLVVRCLLTSAVVTLSDFMRRRSFRREAAKVQPESGSNTPALELAEAHKPNRVREQSVNGGIDQHRPTVVTKTHSTLSKFSSRECPASPPISAPSNLCIKLLKGESAISATAVCCSSAMLSACTDVESEENVLHGSWDLEDTMSFAATILLQKPSYQPCRRVVRISMKIQDREPEQLTASWQASLGQYLQAETNCKLRAAYVLRGCTQIIFEVEDMDADVPMQQQHAFVLAEPAHDWVMQWLFQQQQQIAGSQAGDAGGDGTLPIMLQLPYGFLPQLCGPPARTADGLQPIPPAVVAVTPAVASSAPPACSGETRKVLTLQLASALPPGVAPLARHNGGFLHVQLLGSGAADPVDGVHTLDVELQVPEGPGLLQLELHDWTSGALGPAAPLLLLPSAAAAEEVCNVLKRAKALFSESAEEEQQQGLVVGGEPVDGASTVRAFMLDLGHWLESAELRAQEAASPVDPSAAVLSDGSKLLNFCLEFGMPACAAVIGDALVRGCRVSPDMLLHSCGPEQWFGGSAPADTRSRRTSMDSKAAVTAEEEASMALTPLHTAVKSGMPEVLRGLVAWAHCHGLSPDWSVAGPRGLTPLHLAALVPNNEEMVLCILEAGGHAAAKAWLTARAADGKSPAAYGATRSLAALTQLARTMLTQPLPRSTSLRLDDAAAGVGVDCMPAEAPAALREIGPASVEACGSGVTRMRHISKGTPVSQADASGSSRQAAAGAAAPASAASVSVSPMGPANSGVLPLMWTAFVVTKCAAAAIKSIMHGQGLPELFTVALWSWPYIAILVIGTAMRAGRLTAANSPLMRRVLRVYGSAPSPVRRACRWIANGNLGVLLHLHRLMIVTLMGNRILQTPQVFRTVSEFLVDAQSKALYSIMEGYSLWAVLVMIPFGDVPAWYCFYTYLGVPHAWMHVLGLSGLAAALHVAVAIHNAGMRRRNKKDVGLSDQQAVAAAGHADKAGSQKAAAQQGHEEAATASSKQE